MDFLPSTSTTHQRTPRTQEFELLFLIYKFLKAGPYRAAAEALENDIEQLRLVPSRTAFNRAIRPRSLRQLEEQIGSLYAGNTLANAGELLLELLNSHFPPSLGNLRRSLLGLGHQSLTRREVGWRRNWRLLNRSCVVSRASWGGPASAESRGLGPNQLLFGREVTGRFRTRSFFNSGFLRNYDLHCRIGGHLASAFCLTFDRSGQYIITGSDDNLVKLWSAVSGRLRFTFKGCAAEITDMTVSYDNTLLAVGSVDKTLRVWCLRTGNTVGVLLGHSAMVTSLYFLPLQRGNTRYLVSTGNDCAVCFWHWDNSHKDFAPSLLKFAERSRPGAQMVCATSSPGGLFYATGSSDCHIRIYSLQSAEPEKILEVEAHSDRVDSLQWAHRGLRFLSGSKDGSAKIWNFREKAWRCITLKVSEKKTQGVAETETQKGHRTRVTMVAWSGDDELVVTGASDFILRVWDSRDGSFLRFLSGHKDESFVLQSHPLSPHSLLSAGHDGCLILWDLESGAEIKKHCNFIQGQGYGAFFDAQFSPDGATIAAVDSHGNLSILGLNSDERLGKVPKEQFFHTDYRPLIRDNNGYVLDEQTQTAPHLMPPPFLVSGDGSPYPPEEQVFVPGKEKLSRSFLYADILRRTDEETSLVDVTAVEAEQLASNSDTAEEAPTCVWLTRPLIKPLPQSTWERTTETILALDEEEAETFLRENVKSPPRVRNPSEPLLAQERFPKRRRKEKLPPSPVYQTRNQQRIPWDQELNQEQGTNSSNEDEEEAEEDEEEEEETSDSDYSEPEPSTSRSAATRAPRSRAPLPRARVTIQEEESAEEEEEDERSASSPERPGPSRRRSAAPKKKDEEVPMDGGEFPGWLSLTEPRKTPYLPQVGDEIVYFPVGHSFYLSAVEREQLYPVTSKMHPKQGLQSDEFGVVECVKYVNDPYRLACLRIFSRGPGGRRWIRYHDMSGVIDFIVLRQHYETGAAREWAPGTRFQSVIDNKWWFGTVVKETGRETGHFQSLTVRWETGEEEQMSPWDIEPFRAETYPGKKSGAMEANPEELRAQGAYRPKPGEWSSEGREADCERLLRGVEEVETFPTSEHFKEPVDLNLYPDYSTFISYPIDLVTIKARLRNLFYRRLAALEMDVRKLAENAMLYNEDGTPIVLAAKITRETIMHLIRNPDDPRSVEEIHSGLSSCPEAELDAMESDRRREEAKKEIKPTALPSWMEECQTVMRSLLSTPQAAPFIDPEDNELGDVFDHSISLKSIQEKLDEGRYSSPELLYRDVDSLFQNSRSVATNKRSMIYKAALALHSRFNEDMRPILDAWKRHTDITQHKVEKRLRHRPSREHLYNTRTRAALSVPKPQKRPSPIYLDLTSSNHRTPATSSSEEPAESRREKRQRQAPKRERVEEEPEASTSHSSRLNGWKKRTRQRGKRTVRYDEDSSSGGDNSETPTYSQSSRGRIRKLRRIPVH